jgi:hypothetical protein
MFDKLFGKKPKKPSSPMEVYLGLRGNLFALDPSSVKIAPDPELPTLWGILMEMSMGGVPITVVSLADGTTSLYTARGGGMIGMGAHKAVADMSRQFIAVAEQYLPQMAPITEFPTVALGHVKFYALSYKDGVFTTDQMENELETGQHPFSNLYGAGQNVITQMRLHQNTPAPPRDH